MATLLNDTDQLAIIFDIGGRRGERFAARLAFQHYAEPHNAFHTFAEARVEIHEADLRNFATHLREFGLAEDDSRNFRYEPGVEPSFDFEFGKTPEGELGPYIASAGVDMNRVLRMTQPVPFRENRLALRLRTTHARAQRFLAELLKETDSALLL